MRAAERVLRQQVGDAEGDGTCLAAARAGEHQERRPSVSGGGLGLRGVQLGHRCPV